MNGGIAFLGIPFAQPPVGALRWAAPREPEGWDALLECTRFAAICPQSRVPRDGVSQLPIAPERCLPPGMDEDCLYLNVYTPSLQGKRPTMVWFFGGNLTSGSTSGGLEFDPAARAGNNPSFLSQSQDVVVVTVTYRVNVFGFLCLKGGDANCGLLDAAAGLRWVQREISRFGGDSENVTVVGCSAGAHICSQLMCMPAAKGLFQKAICMSGSAMWSMGSAEDHDRRIAEPFAKKLGFRSLEEMTIEKAREIPAAVLRQAYLDSGDFLESGALTIDGVTIPRDPLTMMVEGFAKDVQVLTGVTRDEGIFSSRLKASSSLDDVVEELAEHLGTTCYLFAGDMDYLRDSSLSVRKDIAGSMVKDYMEFVSRFQASPADSQARSVNLGLEKALGTSSSYELSVKILGDHDFALAHFMAAWALSQHAPVYAYVFSNGLPGEMAAHGSDQQFLFGTRKMQVAGDAASRLSTQIMEAWCSFARSGSPAADWPPISFPRLQASQRLPSVPSGWEHMNFEHGRTGLVSYGAEEVHIWLKHLDSLVRLVEPAAKQRPASIPMRAALC